MRGALSQLLGWDVNGEHADSPLVKCDAASAKMGWAD